MDQRKLIKLGNSSFAIALPKNWIEKSGLKKGDNIFIMPNSNGELIVSSEFKKINNAEPTTINVNEKDNEKIKREFISAYINGAVEFRFIGKSLKERGRYIKKMVTNFTSCEVCEEKKDILLVKDFFNFEEINIELFTRRANNNILEMFDLIIESLNNKGKKKLDLANLEEADADINKIYFLNARLLNLGLQNPAVISILKTETNTLFNNWWLTFNLEHAGDEIKNTGIILNNIKPNKDLMNKANPLIIKTKEVYEGVMKAFYEKDKEKAHYAMEQGKLLYDKCDKITKIDNSFVGLICERLKNIENSTFQITKMILNLR